MSRLFFGPRADTRLRRCRIAAAAVLLAVAASGAARTSEGVAPVVAVGAAGATRIAVLDCASGAERAAIAAPAELAAAAVLAPDGSALYAVTRDRQLLRYALPELREQARRPLGFEPTAVAAAGGPHAVVLVGGRGADALSAHDPATLAELHRYRMPEPFAVSAIRDTAARRRFVVGFSDLEEAWEIAYDPDAPPVLQGLVHDYRSGEAVPLPGWLTARRFELPSATRALAGGPVPYEVARIDRAGALGIVHLDVRREIERPATDASPDPGRIAAWHGDGRRGWLLAAPGAAAAQVLESGVWRVTGRVATGGEIHALGEAGGRVLVAHAADGGVAISLLDVASRKTELIVGGIAAGAPPLRFVAGTSGCVALLDRGERWLAGFVLPPSRSAN